MYVANDCGILKEENIKMMKDFYAGKIFTGFEKTNRQSSIYN